MTIRNRELHARNDVDNDDIVNGCLVLPYLLALDVLLLTNLIITVAIVNCLLF